jgi:hypothetical protein
MAKINNGIINDYTIKPKNLTQYTAFRGVTDFTQIGQFAQYESGYSFLSVIKMPTFMSKLAAENSDIKNLVDGFKWMLEYEFRGLDGLPDITAETYTISDGINEQNLINTVKMDTSITVSMQYYEKTGTPIARFSELYLTGIKDPKSQAKTYHGLIKNNILEPSPENEVFTLLYYNTDNTMLRLERAVLLANCQLTKAELSQYNAQRSDINNKEVTIEFTCFPVMGYQVDKAASKLLSNITGVTASYNNGVNTYKVNSTSGVAALDSADYKYAIMNGDSPSKIPTLVSAAK